ncbi:hypothetical protein ACTXT7_005755 [Hymenolepis weldensis]
MESKWFSFLNIASKFMGIFNLVLLMLLLGHWNACLQFLIPLLMDYPEDSWVQRCRLRKFGMQIKLTNLGSDVSLLKILLIQKEEKIGASENVYSIILLSTKHFNQKSEKLQNIKIHD